VADLVAQAILDKETRRSKESAREMGIPFEPTDWSQISKQTRGWWKNTARTAIEVYRSAIAHKAA
jgi:hypothetical protein